MNLRPEREWHLLLGLGNILLNVLTILVANNKWL